MANNPKNTENLKPFQSGHDDRRNYDGRPPLLVSHVNEQLKDEGHEPVTPAQVLEAYALLINLSEDRIKAINTNADYPMFLRIVGRAMVGEKGSEMIEKILERAYGKATQPVKHSGAVASTVSYNLQPGNEPIPDDDDE